MLTSDKDNLTLVFNEMELQERLEEEEEDHPKDPYKPIDHFNTYLDDDKFFPFQKFKYRTHCCYGLSMDLLENIARELEFDFRLYIVADGLFGTRTPKGSRRGKRQTAKKLLNYRIKLDGQAEESDLYSDEVSRELLIHNSFAPLIVTLR